MTDFGVSDQPISLLYVDDEPALLEIGRIFLEKSGNIAVSTCVSANKAIEILSHQGFDAIVSDYQMPGMNGLRFLQHLRKTGNQTPFIIFTGKGREDVVIEALNSGADFYLQKGGDPKSQFAELSNKILYAVARRRSEMKLAHTFDLMRYIIEHNNASVAVHDKDMNYIFVSKRYLEIFGVRDRDIIGRNHYDIFPDLPKRLREIHRRVLDGEGVFSADNDPNLREDGTIDWARWECRPWFESDGTIGGLIVYTENITERKLKEEELRKKNEELSAAEEEMRSQLEEIISIRDQLEESNEYLNNLFTYANAPIIVWDQQYRITRYNNAFGKLTGISPDKAIGSELSILFPEEKKKESMDLIKRAMTGEMWDVVEIPIQHQSGEVRTVVWNSANIRGSDGETIIATIAQGQDITEQKKAEMILRQKNEELSAAEEELRSQLEEIISIRDQLEESNEYLGNLFTYANAPIIVWDQQYRITRFNNAFGKMTGIPPDKAIGSELSILFPEEKKKESMDLIKRAMTGEMWDVVEIPIQHQSGEVRTVIWNSANIRESDGETIIATIAQGQDITEQKKAEMILRQKNEELSAAEEELRSQLEEIISIRDQLEESNEYLGNLFTYANAPIIVWDQQYRITRFNNAFGKMTGIPPDKAIGSELSILFPEEKKKESMDLIKRAMTGEMWDVVEIPIQHQSGEVRTVIWNSANIRESDGETIIATIAQGQDITEQKKLEEELQKSRNRYQSLVSNVPGVVYRCLLDSDWTMLYLNDDIKAITGYPASDFIRNAVRTYASIIHPDDSAYIERSVNEAVRADETFGIEYRIITRNGDTRWVYENGRAAVDGYEDTRVLDGIIIDITDKKEAEEKVKNEEAFIKTLLETSPAFFVAIGENGIILKMNTALLKALEYREEDLIGKEYLTTIVPEEEHDYLRAILSRIMNTEETTTNLNHIISRTGNRLLVEWHGRRASSEEMAPNFIVSVGIDITGRVLAEDALREANRRLNLLSSITRHDILNKIMTIKGYLEVAEDIEKDRSLSEYIDYIKNAAHAIEKQIEFSRHYEQLGVHEPEWTQISTLIEELDDSELPINCDCDSIRIHADPMIGKVFLNLYDNAIRYAEGATGISVRCMETEAGLLITWEDDGPGIPYDQKEKIFESGYGRHTGFGLFLVREILDITGITISETGVPGDGARFEILVPKGGFQYPPGVDEGNRD